MLSESGSAPRDRETFESIPRALRMHLSSAKSTENARHRYKAEPHKAGIATWQSWPRRGQQSTASLDKERGRGNSRRLVEYE